MSHEHHQPPARQPNHNGWTPARQQQFLDHLQDCGSVAAAARAAGMSRQSAYWLRRQPGAEAFASAWDAALADPAKQFEQLVMDRIIDGEEEVIERDGCIVEVRRRPCDVRLVLAHLKRLDDRRTAQANIQIAVLQRHWDRQEAAAAPPRPHAVDASIVSNIRAEIRADAEAHYAAQQAGTAGDAPGA